jgi:hypothetical protein
MIDGTVKENALIMPLRGRDILGKLDDPIRIFFLKTLIKFKFKRRETPLVLSESQSLVHLACRSEQPSGRSRRLDFFRLAFSSRSRPPPRSLLRAPFLLLRFVKRKNKKQNQPKNKKMRNKFSKKKAN